MLDCPVNQKQKKKYEIQNDIKILVSVTASVFAVSRRVIKGKRANRRDRHVCQEVGVAAAHKHFH